MNEFIGKWRNFITDSNRISENLEIGDTVVMKGDEREGRELTIIDKRTMFGSNLQAFTVQDKNGMGRSEYDETQLVKIGGVEDRAARSAQFNDGDEFEGGYVDDPSNPLGEPGDLDADDVLDGVIDEELFTPNEMSAKSVEDENLAEIKSLNESAPGYNTRKFGHPLPTLESIQAAHEAKEEPKAHVKEDSFSGAEIDPNVELYSNDAVDWNFEESIKKIIDELKEYQKVNPQDDLQTAINHLEYLIFIKEDINYDEFDEKDEFEEQTIDPEDLTYPLESAMARVNIYDLGDIKSTKQFNDLVKAMEKTGEVPDEFFALKAEEQMGIIRQAVMYI